MDYARAATEMFKLDDVDMVGRTVYLTVMDYLGTLAVNADEQGEAFGVQEAKEALVELVEEIESVKKDLEA